MQQGPINFCFLEAALDDLTSDIEAILLLLNANKHTQIEYVFESISYPDAVFIWAVTKGNSLLVNRLLALQCVNPAVCENHAIKLAAKNGHLGVVKCLLEDERVDPSAGYNEPISWAAARGYVEIVALLLTKSCVNPGANQDIAISSASENGHYPVVKVLLSDARVNPTGYENHALRFAAKNGHLGVLKLLLADKRVDPAVDNFAAMRLAIENGHLDIVYELCKHPGQLIYMQINFADTYLLMQNVYIQAVKDCIFIAEKEKVHCDVASNIACIAQPLLWQNACFVRSVAKTAREIFNASHYEKKQHIFENESKQQSNATILMLVKR